MSEINIGQQEVTFDYKEPAEAKEFNKLLRGAVKPGFVSGGEISRSGDIVTIQPFLAYLNVSDGVNDDKMIQVRTSITCNIDMTESGRRLSDEILYMTYTWIDTENCWLDFNTRLESEGAILNEVIIGSWTSGDLSTISDNKRTFSLYDENYNVKLSDVVIKGNLSVGGNSVFSEIPTIPVTAPTLDTEVTNKKFVDDSFINAQGHGNGFDADTIDGAEKSTDGTFATNSDNLIPTEKASKTYSDSILPIGATLPFSGTTIPPKFLVVDGSSLNRTIYNPLFDVITKEIGNFTVAISTDAVFTLNGHGLFTGDNIELTTDGALPTGLAEYTNYFIEKIDSNSFYLCPTRADSEEGTNRIATSGTQSGTHTLRYTPYGINGSTDFLLPDLRGAVLIGTGENSNYLMANGNPYVGNRLGIGELDLGQGHYHGTKVWYSTNEGSNGIKGSNGVGIQGTIPSVYDVIIEPTDDGTNGPPRFGAKNTPFTMSTQFIIKYK